MKASRLVQLFDKLLNCQYLSQFLASKAKKNALKAAINSFKYPIHENKVDLLKMTGFCKKKGGLLAIIVH